MSRTGFAAVALLLAALVVTAGVRSLASGDAVAPAEEEAMSPNPVIWWEINAKDGEALTVFYNDVLGWDSTHDEKTGIWHIASGGDTPGSISGGIFTGKGVLPPHRCLYVRVANVDAITRKAEAQGREILQGPFNLEGVGRLAFFEDPEGHMIGLIGPAREANDGD